MDKIVNTQKLAVSPATVLWALDIVLMLIDRFKQMGIVLTPELILKRISEEEAMHKALNKQLGIE